MKKKLIIIGDGEIAKIAYEYFMSDSEYTVEAFAVEKEFKKKNSMFGIPIINFEDITEEYPPEEGFYAFVAISFISLNRTRSRIFNRLKTLGYSCASYISSKSFCNKNVFMGENVFVFENATIQRGARIGDNTFVWNGAQVSHRTIVGDNCWIAPSCAIAGCSHIKNNCFLGINSTVIDYIVIEEDTMLGAGAVCIQDITEKGTIYVGNPAKKLTKSAYEYFNIQNKN